MRKDQVPKWLDNLVSKESHVIAKKAQDDQLADIEARIDNAETPEELDALEKELDKLEASSVDEGSDEEGADEGSDEEGAAEGTEDEDADVPDDVDISDVMKEVKDVKKEVGSEKEDIQRKLVGQLEQLNDQMGLNKIVDLNSTIDTGM